MNGPRDAAIVMRRICEQRARRAEPGQPQSDYMFCIELAGPRWRVVSAMYPRWALRFASRMSAAKRRAQRAARRAADTAAEIPREWINQPLITEWEAMPKTRVYEVLNKQTLKSRLVTAANAAMAFRHVARDVLTVTIPSTQSALELQRDGVKLENAGDMPDLVQQAEQAGVRG